MMTVRSIRDRAIGSRRNPPDQPGFFQRRRHRTTHSYTQTTPWQEVAGDFLAARRERQDYCLLTMLTFNTKTPSSCGIVEIDNQQVVQAFHEKLVEPPGNRANGALYAFEQDFLDHLNLMNPIPSDFSTEVIPKC